MTIGTAAGRAARIREMEDIINRRGRGRAPRLAKPARERERRKAARIYGEIIQLNELEARNGGLTAEETQKRDRLCKAYDRANEQAQMQPEMIRQAARYTVLRDTPEHAALLDAFRRPAERVSEPARDMLNYDTRAQSVGTDSGGGFAVPDVVMPALERNLQAGGGIRRAPITILPTEDGRDLPIPTANDTGNVGVILAENAGASDQDVTFGQIILKAYKFSSDVIKTSQEFLDDSSFDVVQFLLDAIAERLGRGLATFLINGDGVSEPGGLDMAGSFVSAAAASAISRTDILNLIHSVDPVYRASPAFGLALGDGALKAIKTITVSSTDARPLWQVSMRDGEPDTIEGEPYWVVNEVQDPGGGNRSVFAGDFSKFILREAGPVRIKRLVERYGEIDQIGFVAFGRYDSAILDAGTDPLKYLLHPAS